MSMLLCESKCFSPSFGKGIAIYIYIFFFSSIIDFIFYVDLFVLNNFYLIRSIPSL